MLVRMHESERPAAARRQGARLEAEDLGVQALGQAGRLCAPPGGQLRAGRGQVQGQAARDRAQRLLAHPAGLAALQQRRAGIARHQQQPGGVTGEQQNFSDSLYLKAGRGMYPQ